MPERSSLAQGTQIGVEVTPGTAVAASIALKSFDLNLSGHGETVNFRPMGSKYQTQVNPSREWAVAPITGRPTYDEIMYLLAGIIGTPVDTITGTTGKSHVFTPNVSSEDAVKTFTIEKGGSVRAHKAAYGLITDMTLTMSDNEVTVAGNAIAQRITDGITMTASPTTLPQVPILGSQLDVYVDATRGALGTTKLTRVFSATFGLGNRFGSIWTMNSAVPSFAAHVETEPAATLGLTLEGDSTGTAYLTNYRGGTPLYVRLLATGPQIGAGPAVNKLQIDCCAKINAWNEFSDQDGVYSIQIPMTLVDDGTAPYIVTVINSTASL